MLSQGEVIGMVNSLSDAGDTVLCAAGSLPGDLHKLWRTRNRRGYHLEYGYSTMGYEIAGGMGVKLADPEREVWVMVGDGSFLMMHTEIVTMVQEGLKVNIIVLDNHGARQHRRLVEERRQRWLRHKIPLSHQVRASRWRDPAHRFCP